MGNTESIGNTGTMFPEADIWQEEMDLHYKDPRRYTVL